MSAINASGVCDVTGMKAHWCVEWEDGTIRHYNGVRILAKDLASRGVNVSPSTLRILATDALKNKQISDRRLNRFVGIKEIRMVGKHSGSAIHTTAR